MTDVGRADGLGALDLRRVLVEIDEEVARRRAAGEIPPGLEHELDATFARFSPAASTGSDSTSIIAAAERTAFVDVDVPTASAMPGVPVVKKALRKGMAWYLRYLAQQTSAFNAAAVRALRSNDERLTALEHASPAASPHLRAAVEGRSPTPTSADLVELAVATCSDATGRVLVADAGDGALVRALAGAGVDAYGIDPRRTAANRALADGLDVRVADVADHLGGVADGVLGAVVLREVVERLPAAAALAVAEAAVRALAPGGALLVASASPAAWARGIDPVAADLSPGRPLASATWVEALGRLGLEVEAVHQGPVEADLEDLEPGTPGAGAVNANNALLRDALFGPVSYTVVARRAR